MTVRVKICGIRSRQDLTIAVDAGADALGFIVGLTHFSEDGLDPAQAKALISAVPPYVSTVLVTHLETSSEILDLADTLGVDTIQVHGLVSHETLRQTYEKAAGRRITCAVHVTGTDAVDIALERADSCHAIHLDSRTADRLGGTGETHDWKISREIVDRLAEISVPVILSGGLNPDNVREAIEIVNPYAIDVNSGVELPSGDKDRVKVRAFVRAGVSTR